jgi:hypothetical protein
VIFPADMAKLVLEGRKTLTIHAKYPDEACCRWKPGSSYSIQVSRRTSAERLTVTWVEARDLAAINIRELKRAGFKKTGEFRERWESSHPGWVWTDESPVWLVSFLLGDHTNEPRLLAAHCGGASGDYVSTPSRALPGAGEEVPAAYQAKLASEASDGLRIARNARYGDSLLKLQTVINEMRSFRPEPIIAKQLRGIERQAKSMERNLTKDAT